MLKNFFVVAYRNLVRHANYALINALGLSIGIASCIVIFLVVQFELGFDTFNSKYDHIYRVVGSGENASGIQHMAITPYPFIKAFRNDFTDVPLNTQFHFQSESQLSYGKEKMKLENFIFADSLFFDVFDFGVISGNPKVDLGHPGKVFLTESLQKKLGDVKTLKLDNKLELEVAGIVKDPPARSHITYTMVVSMPSFNEAFLGLPTDQWGMRIAGFSYVALPDKVTSSAINERLKQFAEKYKHEEDKNSYYLQALSDIHFNDQYAGNVAEKPAMTYSSLLILMVLGAFILAVACINFINLSTALAVNKSREIGVRKTLGANQGQLRRQYLMEAFLITFISAVISVVIVQVTIGRIGQFLEKYLEIDFINNPMLVVFLIALILVTALMSGVYPAFILSRFQPSEVLKNKLTNRLGSGAGVRKYLVMFQFLVAQMLIIATLVVANQMEFFKSKPLGFSKDAIINVVLPERNTETRSALEAGLSSISQIESISFSGGAPTSENNLSTGFFLTERGKAESYDAGIKPVDIHYLETYKLELVAGNWFSPNEEKFADFSVPEEQRVYNYVVNEALVRRLGFSSPEQIIGKKITTGLNDINATVIGVVKDFHTKSLKEAVKPVALIHFPYFYFDAGIRFSNSNIKEVLGQIEKKYNEVFPDYLFEYSFLDEHLASLYQQEEKLFTLIRIFAGLAIVISCLGLLGLVSFLTQQKVKEVGIRKVFGASVKDIVVLFSKGFMRLILISFFVAAPLGWYLMDKWLEGFAYQAPIRISVFVIAIGATVFVALFTVSFQSVKAALANPAKSLRNE